MNEAYTDEQLVETIDHVLSELDDNRDGYISYIEYRNEKL